MQLALQVAVLAAQDYSRADIARLTGAAPAELKGAWDRLARIAPRIDRDSDL